MCGADKDQKRLIPALRLLLYFTLYNNNNTTLAVTVTVTLTLLLTMRNLKTLGS